MNLYQFQCVFVFITYMYTSGCTSKDHMYCHTNKQHFLPSQCLFVPELTPTSSHLTLTHLVTLSMRTILVSGQFQYGHLIHVLSQRVSASKSFQCMYT